MTVDNKNICNVMINDRVRENLKKVRVRVRVRIKIKYIRKRT